MLGHGLLAMRWTRLSILPRRRQALEEDIDARRFRRRRFCSNAMGRQIAQRLLSKPDLLQQSHRVEAFELRLSLSLIAGAMLLCAKSRSQGVAGVKWTL